MKIVLRLLDVWSCGRLRPVINNFYHERRLLKLQGVIRFALQILPADNLKGFKTQPKTKESASKTQGTNGMELASATPEFQEPS
jgi:hypothetical protein